MLGGGSAVYARRWRPLRLEQEAQPVFFAAMPLPGYSVNAEDVAALLKQLEAWEASRAPSGQRRAATWVDMGQRSKAESKISCSRRLTRRSGRSK